MTSSAKRRAGEDFEAYKKRLKQERKALKRKTRGAIVWNSSNVIRKPDGIITEMVKVRNQGTYVKGVGKLYKSFADKNRYDQLKKNAERKRRMEIENAEA
jgi:hypothetical protein